MPLYWANPLIFWAICPLVQVASIAIAVLASANRLIWCCLHRSGETGLRSKVQTITR
jgi:hypothetical protein